MNRETLTTTRGALVGVELSSALALVVQSPLDGVESQTCGRRGFWP